MSIIHSDKRISASQIPCDGTLKVTISLTAKPDIQDHPADVVLVLDRSRSMAGAPLASMKAGAKTFIDILAESTGGSQDGQIGGGSRIAVVSFASTATKDTQLITSVAALKAAVDSLTAAGSTNHADAFTKAGELFDPSSSAQKIIVRPENHCALHRRQDHHWSAACAGCGGLTRLRRCHLLHWAHRL